MSDRDDDICPLCVEELDVDDKNFLPCPCGYRVSFYLSNSTFKYLIIFLSRRYVCGVGIK